MAENPLSHLEFSIKTARNSKFINAKLTSFLYENGGRYACEWTDDFLTSEAEDTRFMYLYDKHHLYGVISFDPIDKVDGIPYVYSYVSCTFERMHIEGHPELSSGRVLRAFKIANIIQAIRGRADFIYWGNVISDATMYNRAMGLVEFTKVGVPMTPDLLRYIQTKMPDYTEEDLLHFNPETNNAMFFPILAEMQTPLLEKGITAYNVIRYILPQSSKLGRLAKRKKSKRKLHKKNKKSIKM
jgi:hypothetical protein